MTVQEWCPNHNSGGTERTAISGMTARPTQPTEDDLVSANQSLEALLIPGRRPASSLVREPYARLPLSRRFARLRIILQPLEVPCNRADDRDGPPDRHRRSGHGRHQKWAP